MDINKVKELARTTMDTHGLRAWTLKMVRSKSYAGMCKTGRWDLNPELSWGTIELSIDFMEVFDHEHALDTILHEIAHALDEPRYKTVKTRYGTRQRAIHHDEVWRAIAKRIGCNGLRCVSHDAPKIKERYRGLCPNGHETYRSRMTYQGQRASCPRCDKKYNPKYMFDWYDNGVLIHSHRPKDTTGTVLGTKTGRMSQTNPDLTAIPVATPVVSKTPYVPQPNTKYSFSMDEDLTPEQIRILNGLLTKV
jgi:predicted SprT family Zn-dependent metalloprotease